MNSCLSHEQVAQRLGELGLDARNALCDLTPTSNEIVNRLKKKRKKILKAVKMAFLCYMHHGGRGWNESVLRQHIFN